MTITYSFKNFLAAIAVIQAIALPKSHAVRSQRSVEASNTLRYCHLTWFGDSRKTARPGPEVELARDFVKSMKLQPAGEVVLWDDFFKNNNGRIEKDKAYQPRLFDLNKCDFYAANMTMNSWRESKFTIIPYHAGRIMIVARKEDAAKYRRIEDLRGRRTIVTSNSTLQSELEKANQTLVKSGKGFEIQTTLVGGTDQALLDKKVDFIALDTSQSLQVMHKANGRVTIAFAIGDNQSVGWGFPKSSNWLQKRFNDFVEREKKDEDSHLNKIFKSYYGVSLSGYQEIVQNAQRTL